MEQNDAEMKVEDTKNQMVVEDAGIEYTEEAKLNDIEPTEDSVAKIIDRLNSEDWKENFYGFDDLRSLYKHHPEEFKLYLPKLVELIKEGVENLRSSICRNSLNLVVEVFSTKKNMTETDENGEVTPYAALAVELLPIVCKKLADDKVFLSSRAKTATELISNHCISPVITHELCDLSRSKSLVIASEANHCLRANCVQMESEYVRNKDNVEKLLKTLSEDMVSKRQPFSKNSKLILKDFKEKLGDEELQNVAREALGSEDEVK